MNIQVIRISSVGGGQIEVSVFERYLPEREQWGPTLGVHF